MRIALTLLILFCCAFSAAAQIQAKEFTFKVTGKTVDTEKQPYRAMYLEFVKEGFKASALSDEKGEFSVDLPVGRYEVHTSQATSKTFLAFLEITEKGPNPTGVEFTIELNKDWCSNCAPDKTPEVVTFASPAYPPTARAIGAIGEVVIAAKIRSDGKVISARQVSGHPLLRAVAAQAARSWVFSPDDTIAEREVILVFAFGDYRHARDTKKGDNSWLRKPNRLEIFPPPVQLDI